MRTVTFQSVLEAVARRLGMNPKRDLTLDRSRTIASYIQERMIEGWKFDFWSEWSPTEQRSFRKGWVLNDFAQAGDEVLFIPDGNYYQALQTQALGTQAPALLSGSSYVENSAWWARSASQYSASDWVSGATYAVGQQVRNLVDGSPYQCISAHTAGGTFDATKWGVLKAFSWTIDYQQQGANAIDAVKGVYRRDPRVFKNRAGELPFALNENGVQVGSRMATPPSTVWMTFRLPPPIYTAEAWVSGQAYDEGDVVYYQGDCYLSLIGNNTGPVESVSNWSLQPVPATLASWVKRAAAGDSQGDQKQTDRKAADLEEGHEELSDVWDREMAAQGQFESAVVATYGA
jgi:hypothetical protein